MDQKEDKTVRRGSRPDFPVCFYFAYLPPGRGFHSFLEPLSPRHWLLLLAHGTLPLEVGSRGRLDADEFCVEPITSSRMERAGTVIGCCASCAAFAISSSSHTQVREARRHGGLVLPDYAMFCAPCKRAAIPSCHAVRRGVLVIGGAMTSFSLTGAFRRVSAARGFLAVLDAAVK